MTKYQEIYAGKQVCCTCAHYHQHYGRRKKGYFLLFCGHCAASRTKARKPDQTCGRWEAIKEEPASTG